MKKAAWFLAAAASAVLAGCGRNSFAELAAARNLSTGTAVAVGDLFQPEHIEIIRENSSIVVAENCMKLGSVRPSRSLWNWGDADSLVEFAEKNKIAVKYHTLVWHNQNPPFVSGMQTEEEARSMLDECISTVMSRYKGRIREYDVVNEMFNEDGSLRNSVWLRTAGSGYIEYALRRAREADPDALLFLNEYNNEAEGNPKADAMYRFVKQLKEQGVPVDGVGMQLHLDATLPFSPDAIRSNVRRYADIGVKVSFSEVDVRIPSGSPEKWEQRQQEVYEALLRIALEEPNVTSFITWGFTDSQSWVPQAFPGYGNALLYDADKNPKPVYESLVRILREKK
ncbi:MAG: endo-1,4-beta-xylanase [Treponema sp.]|nr:endo-1,4-beta-xylanase [Treponema sp.]